MGAISFTSVILIVGVIWWLRFVHLHSEDIINEMFKVIDKIRVIKRENWVLLPSDQKVANSWEGLDNDWNLRLIDLIFPPIMSFEQDFSLAEPI